MANFWKHADDVVSVDRYTRVISGRTEFDERPVAIALLPMHRDTADSSNPSRTGDEKMNEIGSHTPMRRGSI